MKIPLTALRASTVHSVRYASQSQKPQAAGVIQASHQSDQASTQRRLKRLGGEMRTGHGIMASNLNKVSVFEWN